jgi:hypothetical protein
MKRTANLFIDLILLALWLGGLLTGLFATDDGNRVVGMLLWIGIGAGYRLRKIEEHTAPKP